MATIADKGDENETNRKKRDKKKCKIIIITIIIRSQSRDPDKCVLGVNPRVRLNILSCMCSFLLLIPCRWQRRREVQREREGKKQIYGVNISFSHKKNCAVCTLFFDVLLKITIFRRLSVAPCVSGFASIQTEYTHTVRATD